MLMQEVFLSEWQRTDSLFTRSFCFNSIVGSKARIQCRKSEGPALCGSNYL